jgi:hypothetical protein
MRNDIHVDVKYDDAEEKLEESKDEDMPSVQIAKVVEKNGKYSLNFSIVLYISSICFHIILMLTVCFLGSYWIFHSSCIEESEEELEKNPESKLWRVVKHCKQ